MLHYKYGGSTAKRLINCPAWVELAEDIPHGTRISEAATLGTALHELIDRSLSDEDYDPAGAIAATVEGVLITKAHILEKIYPALDVFEDIIEQYDLEFITERTMQGKHPDMGGTSDFIGWNIENNILVCLDYKSGDGVIVNAEGNDQLLFYTALATQSDEVPLELDLDTRIIVGIVQPTDRRDEILDTWETDLKTLHNWGDEYARALNTAERGGAKPNAGNWCQFCPVEAVCPTKTGLAAQAMRLPVDSADLESLNAAMAVVTEVEDWTKAVRKLAHDQAEQGVPIKGWKLVNKRASRIWNDVAAVSKKFKSMRSLKLEDYMDMKLMSPPKLEKICKNKGVDFDKFSDYISAVSSGTTLAVEDDKRQAVVPVPALKALADRLN